MTDHLRISIPLAILSTAVAFLIHRRAHSTRVVYADRKSDVIRTGREKIERLESGRRKNKYGTLATLGVHDKIVLVMVGLPARGKSFITRKLTRYLNWVGVPARTFNAGNKRREAGHGGTDSSFFDPTNQKAKDLREQLAMETLDDLLTWLSDEGHVAVFDATNTTKKRRQAVLERCAAVPGVEVIFIESICNDPEILESNYKRKCFNADYQAKQQHQALEDFKRRVAEYEKVYEALDDDEADKQVRYIKIYNVGAKVSAKGCEGFLASQIVFFLQNIHLHPRHIYLVRPGESENLKFQILGLDLGLTDRGHVYANKLAEFVEQREREEGSELLVWAGTMRRIQETVAHFKNAKYVITTPLLNELGGGDMEGLTYEEIEKLYPEEFAARQRDKLHYRYPGSGGESYMDVIERLRPLIVELERQRHSIVVVCHKAVMRVFLSYFAGIEAERVPFLAVHPETVYELSPHVDGISIKTYTVDV